MMKIVIIGGGYAGVNCATRLARMAREAGHGVDITLINGSERFVERIRLHQAAAGQRLPERSLPRLLKRAGVRLVVGWAERLDLAACTMQIGGACLNWDRLVLALGSRSGRQDVPGATEHTCALQSEDVAALATRLRTLPAGARVLIVGGGLTGIEAAAEIKESFPHLQIGLLSRGEIADTWSWAARRHLVSSFKRQGVALYENVEVQAVGAGSLMTSQGELAFELCVWAAGFGLPTLPRASGLAVDARGRICVDPQLRSISHPQVYAAGDIAAPVPGTEHPVPMGCKSALPMGAHVADNLFRELSGQPLLDFNFTVRFFCVSLGRGDGLIQWPDSEGRLLGRVLTGRRAAWFKEGICKCTWWALSGNPVAGKT